MDRIFATLSLCLVGAIFWSMDRSSAKGNFGFGLILIFGISFIFIILILDGRILRPLSKFFEIIKLPSINRNITKLYESFQKYRNAPLKSLAFIFILSLLVHLLDVLIYYLLTRSLGMNISAITIGWVRSLAILATMIPITISGLGVREGVLILLLMPYGVIGEEAFAFSIFIFLTTVLLVGIIGGLYEIGTMISTIAKSRHIGERKM
jgi:uncharacterized protein (TIRG00374 family)